MATQSNILILGGGVAGACLLLRLRDYGISAQIWDLPDDNRSSRRAAGLVNPFIIKRLVLSWKGQEAFEYAQAFYRRLEKQSGISFMDTTPVYRLLTHEEIRSQWEARRVAQPELAFYMGKPEKAPRPLREYTQRALIPRCFRVRPQSFFDAVFTLEGDSFRQEKFDYSALKYQKGSGWKYWEHNFSAVVFCEGTAVVHNPFIPPVFLKPCKGQWLITDNFGLEAGYLASHFFLPENTHFLFTGSTYEFQFSHAEPDAAGREKLRKGLADLTQEPLRIHEQVAGIRPATSDRRPVLGKVPGYEGLYIFNGLGSRGFLLAPFLAECMSRHILKGEALPPESEFQRFFTL